MQDQDCVPIQSTSFEGSSHTKILPCSRDIMESQELGGQISFIGISPEPETQIEKSLESKT